MARQRGEDEDGAEQFPYEFIGGAASAWDQDVSVHAKGDVAAGTYIVMVEAQWKDEDLINDYVFRTYCADPTEIEEQDAGDYEEFLGQALCDCAHNRCRKQSLANRGHSGMFIANDLSASEAGLGMIYVENNEEDAAIKIRVSLPRHSGLDFKDELNDGDTVKV